MRLLGHMGSGEVPTDKKLPSERGSYNELVTLACTAFHQNGYHLLPQGTSGTILLHKDGGSVEFFTFDKAYVERLRAGDPATEHHFVAYFEQLLRIKLRARMLPSDKVDDLQQETFIRVIAALRKEGGIRQPERFGAFVNSICNNVLLEYYRSRTRSQPLEDSHLEIPDKLLDLEGMLATKQASQHVRQILEAMAQRDRDLLRAVFLEDRDKDSVCHEFKVDRDYLRVLLHRAKDKFKSLYQQGRVGLGRRATTLGSC